MGTSGGAQTRRSEPYSYDEFKAAAAGEKAPRLEDLFGDDALIEEFFLGYADRKEAGAILLGIQYGLLMAEARAGGEIRSVETEFRPDREPSVHKRDVILGFTSSPDAVLNALHQAGWKVVPK